MTRWEIDPRIAGGTPDRSITDLIHPLIVKLERAEPEDLAASLVEMRRTMREVFRLARDFESEVSKLRWKDRIVQDAHRAARNEDEAILAAMRDPNSNVVFLCSEVPIE